MTSNPPDPDTEIYDVFLCHNSADKAEVRAVAEDLRNHGIKPWLDESDLHPGRDWDLEIKEQIPIIPAVIIFLGNHGYGNYQEEQEITPFIKEKGEHERRNIPIIPVFLGSAKLDLALPENLKKFQCVDLRKKTPDPILELLRGIIGDIHPKRLLHSISQEDSQKISHQERQEFIARSNKTIDFWKSEASLYKSAQSVKFAIDKTIIKDIVSQSQDINNFNFLPSADGRLSGKIPIEYILDLSRYLLILGESGSGKTTTLNHLATRLLERAEKYNTECIPVILDLSNWKKEEKSLFAWIVENLLKPKEKKGLLSWMTNTLTGAINKDRIQEWLSQGYIIPLLDGLDEVSPDLRADCIEAINTYKENKKDEKNKENKIKDPPGLVVCCRIDEYEKLPRLNVCATIRLEPLEKTQIDHYLEQLGADFQKLHSSINENTVLQDLVKSPLMLDVLPKAKQSSNFSLITLNTFQSSVKAKKYILDKYIESAIQAEKNKEKIVSKQYEESSFLLKEANKSSLFSEQKVHFWLCWLAKNMKNASQIIFYIENLQPSWLENRKQKFFYRIVSGIIFSVLIGIISIIVFRVINYMDATSNPKTVYGLIIALIFGLQVNANKYITGLVCMVLYFLTGWLIDGTHLKDWVGDGVIFLLPIVSVGIYPLDNIKPVERMLWSWKVFLNKFVKGFLMAGLLTLVLVGVAVYFNSDELFNSNELKNSSKLEASLIFGSISGLLCGLTSGLLYGIVFSFTDWAKKYRQDANQGMWVTFGNSLFVYLISLIVLGLTIGIYYWVFGAEKNSVFIALIISLQLALIPALRHGLAAVIKHLSLRLVLWLCGYTPSLLNFIPFLNYCVELDLLKKGGGSYRFYHDILQDYFANLNVSKKSMIQN